MQQASTTLGKGAGSVQHMLLVDVCWRLFSSINLIRKS